MQMPFLIMESVIYVDCICMLLKEIGLRGSERCQFLSVMGKDTTHE